MRNLVLVAVLAFALVALYHLDFRPDDLEGPVVRWVYIGIGGLIGTGLIAAISIGFHQSGRMGGWPQVEGNITRSEAKFVTTRFGNDNSTTHREADIAYDYSVNGLPHQGTRFVQAGAVGEAVVERLLRDYPVGTKVVVHYDPQSPAEAIIERPEPVSPFRYLLLPAVLAAGYGLWLVGNPARKTLERWTKAGWVLLPLALGCLAQAWAAL